MAANSNRNAAGTAGQDTSLSALLVMNYSLYRGGGDIARRREFISRLAEARQRLNQAIRQTEETTRLSWSALLSARDRLTQLRAIVQANENVKDSYRKQFDIGRRTLADLLDSENNLFQSRSNLVISEFVEMFGIYRILASSGMLLATLDIGAAPESLTDDNRDRLIEASLRKVIEATPTLDQAAPPSQPGQPGAVLAPVAPVLDPNAPAPVLDPNAPAPLLDPTTRAPVLDPNAPVTPPGGAVLDPNAPILPPGGSVLDPNAPILPPGGPVLDPNAPILPPQGRAPGRQGPTRAGTSPPGAREARRGEYVDAPRLVPIFGVHPPEAKVAHRSPRPSARPAPAPEPGAEKVAALDARAGPRKRAPIVSYRDFWWFGPLATAPAPAKPNAAPAGRPAGQAVPKLPKPKDKPFWSFD